MSDDLFSLHCGIDAGALRRAFAQTRRVQIGPFLEESSARHLHNHLHQRRDWRLVINSGDKVFELDAAARAALSPEKRMALETAVTDAARRGFQFRFETIRVADPAQAREEAGTLLDRFASFMSGREVLDLLRSITGEAAISWADAQATRYRHGDFLTAHDDAVAGKERRAAYVLGLSAEWRADWGGLLLFQDAETLKGFVPQYNVLTLFAVPQLHSVSYVTPSASLSRISVTGWLRGGAQS